jgi:hypothetical protein
MSRAGPSIAACASSKRNGRLHCARVVILLPSRALTRVLALTRALNALSHAFSHALSHAFVARRCRPVWRRYFPRFRCPIGPAGTLRSPGRVCHPDPDFLQVPRPQLLRAHRPSRAGIPRRLPALRSSMRIASLFLSRPENCASISARQGKEGVEGKKGWPRRMSAGKKGSRERRGVPRRMSAGKKGSRERRGGLDA